MNIVKATKTGNHVVLEFDIDPAGRPSASGKTIVVYSTGGFDKVSLSGYAIGLNITKAKQ